MSSNNSIFKEYFDLTYKYKLEYGDKTIVLLQVGAFFEIYGLKDVDTNEITGSNIIDILDICSLNLAEKKITYKDKQVLMAGFRDNFIDKFLVKLIESGYTVPVYIQEKDGNKIERKLDKVYSSGTMITYETERSNIITNNIMCIWMDTYKPIKSNVIRENIIYGIAVINIFTGKSYIFQYDTIFYMNTSTFDELERYISVYSPSEIILISPFNDSQLNKIIQYSGMYPDSLHIINTNSKSNKIKNCSDMRYIKQIITKFYKEDTYDICNEFQYENIATQAFCYLLDFIQEHNKELIRKISIPEFNNISDRVILANHTLKQLNIIDDEIMESKKYGKYSSVLVLLNKCSTDMGKRKFQYQLTNPVFNVEWLNKEYFMIDLFLNQNNYNFVEPFIKQLKNVRDIEKISRQIIVHKIYPSGMYQLYSSINIINQINICLAESSEISDYLTSDIVSLKTDSYEYINNISEKIMKFLDSHLILDNCKNISSMLNFQENIIQKQVSVELDNMIDEYNNSIDQFNSIKEYLNMIMCKYEKPDIDYIKIHDTEKSGTFLQITQKRSILLKKHMVTYENDFNENVVLSNDIAFTKASTTNMNIDFPKLNKIIKQKLILKDKINDMISKVYLEILTNFSNNYYDILEHLSLYCAKLDVILCKTYISKKFNYCRPEIVESASKSFVNVEDLRHCLIEHIQQNELYVPNSVIFGKSNDNDVDGILLYGTNAVGKTSFIRSLGISIIMAQSGMYVPSSSFKYKPYTAIFSRILGNDNIFKGLSTFAVEMTELRVILKMSDENSLVLGDELCSGTEIESALSIIVTGLIELHKKRSSFIFATHYHELTDIDEIKELTNLKLYHMAVNYDREQNELIYDRKLKEGSGPTTYGLEVCKSLHLGEDFLDKAYEIRNRLFPNSRGELSNKITQYNSNKIRGKCEMCNQNLGEEIHHINQQKDADENGFIGSFHKNHPANLMSICEKCHDKIHAENITFQRKKTTDGYKLKPIRLRKI